MYWAGRLLTIAAIPVYFLAFAGVLRNKRVTFKTTPKGDLAGLDEPDELLVFKPHLILSGLLLTGLTVAYARGHTSGVFVVWGLSTAALLSSFFIRNALRLIGKRLAVAARWSWTAIARAAIF